jgi:hexokinase
MKHSDRRTDGYKLRMWPLCAFYTKNSQQEYKLLSAAAYGGTAFRKNWMTLNKQLAHRIKQEAEIDILRLYLLLTETLIKVKYEPVSINQIRLCQSRRTDILNSVN